MKRKHRIIYSIAFVILIASEVLIALFVHDAFIRPYIGDVLIVLVLYTGIRIIIPDVCRALPLYIFLFAVFVECLQLLNLADLFGAKNNAFLRTIIGSVFDVKDIVCYAVGCVLLGIYEWEIKRQL